MTNRAVFIDRDGTMAKDVPYCRRPEDFELFPNTAKAIRMLNQHGFKVIVITNQSGIGRGYFTEDTLGKIHQKMKDELAKQGAYVDDIYYCPHHPDDGCDCRKPGTKLPLQAARKHQLDLKNSFMVGDMEMDIGMGKAIGCKTIMVGDSAAYNGVKPDVATSDILGAAEVILNRMTVQNKHKNILICVSGIDGSGKTTLARRLISLLKKHDTPTVYAWGSHEQFVSRPLVALAQTFFLSREKRNKDYGEYEKSIGKTLGNSVLSALYRGLVLIEYYAQMSWKVRLPLLLGKNVVTDRYVYDFAINLSIQLGSSEEQLEDSIRRLFSFLPKPDVVFLADVPAEIAFQRKKDIPVLDYVAKRRTIYLKLAEQFGFRIVDASRTVDELSDLMLNSVLLTFGTARADLQ